MNNTTQLRIVRRRNDVHTIREVVDLDDLVTPEDRGDHADDFETKPRVVSAVVVASGR